MMGRRLSHLTGFDSNVMLIVGNVTRTFFLKVYEKTSKRIPVERDSAAYFPRPPHSCQKVTRNEGSLKSIET